MEVRRREKRNLAWSEPGFSRGMYNTIATFFPPSCGCSALPIVPPPSLFLSLISSSPSVLKLSLLHSSPLLLHCLPLFLQSTFLTLIGEWLTPWSRCAAPSWGPSAGTLSLNVGSSYRKSPPSWGPVPGSRGEASDWTRGPRDWLYLWGQGQDFQDRGAPGPGKPRVMAPRRERMDRALGLDLQQERGRAKL